MKDVVDPIAGSQFVTIQAFSLFLLTSFSLQRNCNTNVPATQRVLIAITVITVTNVYFLELISSFILKPDRFSSLFGVTLERARSWSSTASGLIQTIQFSVAPIIFDVLANIEGSATSAGMAQRNAILYFWFFYVVARFMGKIIWDAILSLWAGCKYEDLSPVLVRQILSNFLF